MAHTGVSVGNPQQPLAYFYWVVGMRGIPVSEKYSGINSDGIIYRGFAKYRAIPSGGTDFQ